MRIKTRERVKDLKDLSVKDVLVTYDPNKNAFAYERVQQSGQRIEQKGLEFEFDSGASNGIPIVIRLPRTAEVLKFTPTDEKARPDYSDFSWVKVKDLKENDYVLRHNINMSMSNVLSVRLKKIEQCKEKNEFFIYKNASGNGIIVDGLIVRL